MNRVGVILICTRKYDVFLQPLIDSMEKFFFTGEPYDIYLLTDKPQAHLEAVRGTISVREIPAYRFPFATLYRYKSMVEHKDVFTSQNLYYLDVDMKFVAEVGDEIFGGGLVAVQHPGYYLGGWGSRRTQHASLFYVPQAFWNDYYCGGFQGGRKDSYLKMAEVLSEMIDQDLDIAKNIRYTHNDGILAEYHDESAYNWYLKVKESPAMVLNPSYCYPESWNIPYEKKLLALDKNHKEIRS
jgi:histo-blood group ABO system transferase